MSESGGITIGSPVPITAVPGLMKGRGVIRALSTGGAPALGDVRLVVAGQQEHGRRIGHGRGQPDLVRPPAGQLAGHPLRRDPLGCHQPDLAEPEQRQDVGREHRAAGGRAPGQIEDRVRRRQPRRAGRRPARET